MMILKVTGGRPALWQPKVAQVANAMAPARVGAAIKSLGNTEILRSTPQQPLKAPALVSSAVQQLGKATAPRSLTIRHVASPPPQVAGPSTRNASAASSPTPRSDAPAESQRSWLHDSWKPSAAGRAAMETPRQPSPVIRRLSTTLQRMGNVIKVAVDAVVKPPVKRRAPPPPTPIKPANLTAIFAARDAAVASARKPSALAGTMSIEPQRSDMAERKSTTASANFAPPPPPPMPSMQHAPLTHSASLDSRLPPPKAKAPLLRSSSAADPRPDTAGLFAELLKHKGVHSLKKATIELDSVGKATQDAPVATKATSPSGGPKVGGVDLMGSAANELLAALAKRGKTPATLKGWGTRETTLPRSASPSDSGKSSLSGSNESIPNSIDSARSWSYTPASPDRKAPGFQAFDMQLQSRLIEVK